MGGGLPCLKGEGGGGDNHHCQPVLPAPNGPATRLCAPELDSQLLFQQPVTAFATALETSFQPASPFKGTPAYVYLVPYAHFQGNETYRDQINVADIVVINKVDLVDEAEVQRLMAWGQELFPMKQKVVSAEKGKFDPELLLHSRGAEYTPLFTCNLVCATVWNAWRVSLGPF